MRFFFFLVATWTLMAGCRSEPTYIYCQQGSTDRRCFPDGLPPEQGFGGSAGAPETPAEPDGTCAHSVSVVGPALDPHCSQCVQNVCDADPVCCDFYGEWDDLCIEAVSLFCGEQDSVDEVSGPRSCDIPANEASEIERIYSATDNSIHELIKCGQVQVRLASNLVAVVMMSNRELFSETTYNDLVDYASLINIDLEIPFSQDAGGRWVMPIPGASDSTFSVQFYKPGDETPITANPFVLDSYLKGVRVHTTLSLDEMLQDFALKNTIAFYWDELGPLAGLLNEGRPMPNPVVVRVSIQDLLELVGAGASMVGSSAEYGPFTSLVDAEMTSCVELRDRVGDVEVDYTVDSKRDTVSNIVGSSSLFFDVDTISATSPNYMLVGDATNLRFEHGDLKGQIDYQIRNETYAIDVVGDYGNGASYGTPLWMCVENPANDDVSEDDGMGEVLDDGSANDETPGGEVATW